MGDIGGKKMTELFQPVCAKSDHVTQRISCNWHLCFTEQRLKLVKLAECWPLGDITTCHVSGTSSATTGILRALSPTGDALGSICRCLDFISCSVSLEVMLHSATSSVSGDDISTTVVANSGVAPFQAEMWVYTL